MEARGAHAHVGDAFRDDSSAGDCVSNALPIRLSWLTWHPARLQNQKALASHDVRTEETV
ncbi:MAG: hypothetical protein AVDCRST_MAG87-1477 [uncultured Thermomicrobiales bacterium]|uniref:Uncharacterized protein n=1 Tax=uncultured Thermomicrobiales bacterium TaxID=1645740 RepID=A0A6J4UVS0_9BACT|nr:MAG: hypothetical protein AVDCRST_MAG87-1477 [uncultured Thermomicrobiales bacterium]